MLSRVDPLFSEAKYMPEAVRCQEPPTLTYDQGEIAAHKTAGCPALMQDS